MGKKKTSPRAQAPQSCVFCGKQLSSYSHLIEHINNHTGERPCRCVPCDLWLGTATLLCQHRRIVHERKKLSCPFCSKQFNFTSNLWDHKRRMHFKQSQQLKRRREIQRRRGGSRILIKKTANPSRKLKNKTEKHSTIQENATEEEIFIKEESPEEQIVVEESQDDESWAEGEEDLLEESEEETVYPHQVNNHEEYFRAINQQRLAVLSMIFKTFPPVKLNEDRFQVPKVEPFRPVPCGESVKITEVKNILEVNNNRVSAQNPAPKIIPTSASKECTVCGKYMSIRSNLLKHLRIVHGVQLPVRKYTIKSKREQEGAPENESSPPKSSGNQVKYKCYKCSSLIPNLGLLRKHMTSKHPGSSVKIITTGRGRRGVPGSREGSGWKRGLFKCSECDNQYSWKQNVIKHIHQKHPEINVSPLNIVNLAAPNVSSKLCEKKIKQELQEPESEKDNCSINGVSEVKSFKGIANRVLTPGMTRRIYRSDISKKLTAKINKIVFKCYKCSATLPRVAALKRHMTLKHGNCPTKIFIATQNSSSTKGENMSKIAGAFKCPECGRIFKWKKNLASHIRSTHDSPGNCGTGEALEEPPEEKVTPAENSDQANTDLGNMKNPTLPLKRIVTKRRIPRRAPNVTGNEVKPFAADSSCFKNDFEEAAGVPTDSTPSTSVIYHSPDNSPGASSGGPGRCQCDKCGQWCSSSHNLLRHLNRNGCLHTKRAALNKLDAFLDFICEICNKNFKGDPKNTARYSLECHLATVHRFHHENAREYRQINLRHAPAKYFCIFCGLYETTRSAIVKHLRSNHRDLIGVPKKVAGSTDNPMGTDTNGDQSSCNSEVVKEASAEQLKLPGNSDQVKIGIRNITSSTLSVKRIVKKRRIPRRSSKATETRANVSSKINDKSCAVSGADSKRSGKCKCDKCGRWFGDKRNLGRHLKFNGCLHTKLAALAKLDASLDFTCNICNRHFKGNPNNTARYLMEYHLAKVHRFHHENAREYQHLNKTQAPPIYFCTFCGLKESKHTAIMKHLRSSHRNLIGVRKKTPKKFTGSTDNPMETDSKQDLKEPLKSVKKRRISRRAPKVTRTVAKPFRNNPKGSKDNLKAGAGVPTVSSMSSSDPVNPPDNLQMDKSSSISTACSGVSGRRQCDKCGRWLGDKWKLDRHLKLNGCLHTKRAALNKLDASLDFICNICNKQFKGNSKNTARYFLEFHLATVHRFHHENAREYQQLKLRHAPPNYFCPFCGLNETTTGAIVKHLRSNHRDLLGVLKKTPKTFTGSADNPMETYIKEDDFKEPLKSVRMRRIPRRAPKDTRTVVIADKSKCSQDKLKVEASLQTVSSMTTSDPLNSPDNLQGDKSSANSEAYAGVSGRRQCDKCGRWLGDKWKLARHLKVNGCLHTKRAALNKLDASLDFICNICNKQFKGNSQKPARYSLECHLAKGHRFHHENAREYRHRKLRHPTPIYFCPFCGLHETTYGAIVKHLRSNHRDLLGVPKKTPKTFAGITANLMGIDAKFSNGELTAPLKPSEVSAVVSTTKTIVPNNLTDTQPNDKALTVDSSSRRSRRRWQCDKCRRWFRDKCDLSRHLNRNGCLHTKREALGKLDASLDFFCEICNKEFKGDPKNTARYCLERHLATVHRFHHKNGEKYRHLKLGQASAFYFCTFCGSQEKTATAIVKHLRSNHRDSIGVPKKTPKKFTGSPDNPIQTDPNCSNGDLKKPLQSPEVPTATDPTVSSTNTTSVLNNLPGTLGADTGLSVESSSEPRSRWQCVKCGRCFGEKSSLYRHVERNSCGYAQREALIKLDASLDFICPICNKKFKTNCGARSMLESHISSAHRFDHENGREYRHLKKASGIYFCVFCGSKEASRKGLTDHLRRNHMELLGVPKKTANGESSPGESQETDYGLI